MFISSDLLQNHIDLSKSIFIVLFLLFCVHLANWFLFLNKTIVCANDDTTDRDISTPRRMLTRLMGISLMRQCKFCFSLIYFVFVDACLFCRNLSYLFKQCILLLSMNDDVLVPYTMPWFFPFLLTFMVQFANDDNLDRDIRTPSWEWWFVIGNFLMHGKLQFMLLVYVSFVIVYHSSFNFSGFWIILKLYFTFLMYNLLHVVTSPELNVREFLIPFWCEPRFIYV